MSNSSSNRSVRMLILGALVLSSSGCPDDSPAAVPPEKGRIDRTALEGGITIVIAEDLGTVVVPFENEVPEPADDTGGDTSFQDEMAGAVSLVVTSNQSGTTANLASGTIVEGTPAAPGEWSWVLNDARDEATMTFFNATGDGLTLKSNVTYQAMLSVAGNGYVESEDAFSFDVAIVEN